MLNQKRYSGVGSRRTTPDILMHMTNIASFLESKGYVLYSGGAAGADAAFENGVFEPKNKKIFLPWKDFNGNKSDLYKISKKAVEIAREFHPAWGSLPDGAKKLIARDSYQVLGESLDQPVDLVICYTPNGRAEGGTGQVIRIATKYKIPIFNLQNKKHLDQVLMWIKTRKIDYTKDMELDTWNLM